MTRSLLRALLLGFAASAVLSAPARADLTFGFDGDAQGWVVQAGGTLTHRPTGGSPGGFLEFTDINADDMLAVLSPGGAAWTSYLGGTLSFDAKILSNHQPDWHGFGEVTLSGGFGSVSVDLVPVGLPLANGQWQHFSVPLTVVVFGANLPAVLSSVSTLSIKTEYAISVVGDASSFETLGLDNVAITAVPEPASWALLLAGAALLSALRRRRG